MNLIKNSYPLFLPQKIFIDRFRNVNAFVEMNPSMFIDKNGDVIILVRSVNYKKFYDFNFTLFENFSISNYGMLVGHISNLYNLKYYDIIIEYNLPTFHTYWKGLEDIRFISKDTLLVTVPELNENGNPCLYKAKMTNNKIHSFIKCYPNIIEKIC